MEYLVKQIPVETIDIEENGYCDSNKDSSDIHDWKVNEINGIYIANVLLIKKF